MNPVADKALQAIQSAENLRQEAIAALLKERQSIADQLKALGHVDGQKTPAKTKEPKSDAKKHCKICQVYGHDGRYHKGGKNMPTPPPTAPPMPPKPPAPATAAK
jgi:hypothetical protein